MAYFLLKFPSVPGDSAIRPSCKTSKTDSFSDYFSRPIAVALESRGCYSLSAQSKTVISAFNLANSAGFRIPGLDSNNDNYDCVYGVMNSKT